METFAKRLKYAMDQAGLKQAGLAEKSGAPRSAISQYLSGRNIPGPERMRALAEATSVSLGFLIGEEKPPTGTEPPPVKKISTAAAARCLGKSNSFVRIGLQRGSLPFGSAVPGTGDKFNYYISPIRFRDYVGAERFDEFFGLASKAQCGEQKQAPLPGL